MKLKKWVTCLESAVLSFLISFSACMCLPSAFSLESSPGTLAAVCGLAAGLCSLCFTLRLGLLPPLAAAFAAGYFWTAGTLADSVEGLAFHISRIYDMAYGLGWFYWSQTPPYYADITAALCAAGCIIAMATAFVLCRRKSAVLAVLPALLPLAACLVITDRVPDNQWLFWLLLGLCLLVLCQTVRRADAGRGNRLTAMAAIPVALALLLLFWLIPRETYKGQQRADRLLEQAQQWLQGSAGELTLSQVEQTVDLTQTGQLLELHTPVLTVKSDTDRLLYLRQQGFQMYDGKHWYNQNGDNPYDWTVTGQYTPAGQITVTTRNLHLMQFVPYYANDETFSFNAGLGIMENQQLLYEYTYSLYQLADPAVSALVYYNSGGVQFPVGRHEPDALSLPASTVSWAEPLALSLTHGKLTVREQAEAIADYVRSGAAYSRGTGRMDPDAKDFAQWFLEESDTGYCVHFATATAVLLRAAGIHAQYVTGYIAPVRSGSTVVYQDQAHAWVEYYDPAVGWRVLESTPAEGLPAQAHTSQTPQSPSPTTPSQPTQTLPAPTEPIDREAASSNPWLWLLIPFGILTVLGQWQLRLRYREQRLQTGPVNTRALAYWREIERLHRLLRTKPEQQLLELAQKAKFSQHHLTKQELAQLEDGLEQCQKVLKAKPKYTQLLYTLIFAIY